MKKTIRIKFTDFPGAFNPTRIKALLDRRFDVQIDDRNPDYVIYSVTGHEYMRHPDAVRIYFTGENIHTDFNLCDYAFAYDWFEVGDRYHRCPNYQLYDQFKELCERRSSAARASDPSITARKFCNFIYTNANCHPFRDQFFKRLNEYRKVDSPGTHLRNLTSEIGPAYQGDWSASKVLFQRDYKFSFAFENSSTIGYTTEKIVHAMAADTIPVYWGNPEVAREFNTRRFVNCHDFPDMESAIQRIIALDQDDELYRSVLAEPFFPGDTVPDYLQDERILDQFEYIFSQPKEAAFRRNPHAWGAFYERQRLDEAAAVALVKGRRVPRRLTRLLLALGRRSRPRA